MTPTLSDRITALLTRWAKLEPERLGTGKFRESPDTSFFYLNETGNKTVFTVPIKSKQEWILCGMIEAAIVERRWRYHLHYSRFTRVNGPEKTEERLIGWLAVIEPDQNSKHSFTSTNGKLEALLSAYLTALGAKDSL